MNQVEERIHAAVQAAAGSVHDIRPLVLPPAADGQRRPGSGARARRARRPRTWLAPLTAAAAVIALAISLVIVRDVPNGHVVPPAGPAPTVDGLPPYYVTFDAHGNLVVGETVTGARLAAVPPPAGVPFAGVSAAADDRTFVVDTAPDAGSSSDALTPRVWYLLRIAPGAANPARLTRLSIAMPSGAGIAAMALSRSGRELAIGTVRNWLKPGQTWQLRIYSVPAGKLLRTWTTRSQSVFAIAGASLRDLNRWELTWVNGDRDIAFGSFTRPSHYTVRVISVTGGGTDLIADSRVLWSSQHSAVCSQSAVMVSSDGKTILCGETTYVARKIGGKDEYYDTMSFFAFPASAPKPGPPLFTLAGYRPLPGVSPFDVLCYYASADATIVNWFFGNGTRPTWHTIVFSHGRFRRLPTPAGVGTASSTWEWPAVTW
jgi:hypothetical protein